MNNKRKFDQVAFIKAKQGNVAKKKRPEGFALVRAPVARELKYIDTSLAANAYLLSGAGTLLLLNGCVPGTDAVNRVGRKIVMKSINIRISLVTPSTTVSNGWTMRTILFYDKQSNGAAPVATDLLLTDNFAANNNLSNRDRFSVLMDDVHEPGQGFAAARKHYKFFNLETIFNGGTAGTIADITSGSLYLLTYLPVGAVATTELTCAGRVRVRFEDS